MSISSPGGAKLAITVLLQSAYIYNGGLMAIEHAQKNLAGAQICRMFLIVK
jgi:hypothetical protein